MTPAKKTAIFLITLFMLDFPGCFNINQASAAEDPPAELYVRTVPDGAKVFLGGKEVGVTPGLFKVEPGTAKIVLKLEGHNSIEKEVEIQASRITRLELEFKKPSPDQAIAPNRLISADAAALPAKKVNLYSLNIDPAQAILDLGSGEIVENPAERQEGAYFNSFNRSGKGDLFLFGNSKRVSQFICLRGGAAMQWDGARFVKLPVTVHGV